MHRFFFPNADFRHTTLEVTSPSEIHHLHHVLRLGQGGRIVVFNSQGQEAQGEILAVHRDRLTVKLTGLTETAPKSHVLTLACAIPKKAKFEWIIEKATELGVDEIIPLLTQRTEVRIPADKRPHKTARYQKVAVNAAKQCGRSTVPRLSEPATLAQVLPKITPDTGALIACFHAAAGNLMEILEQNKGRQKFLFLVGPEGDFAPQEVEQALAAGCRPVSLGPTVLKVDTAALTMLAAANLAVDRTGRVP